MKLFSVSAVLHYVVILIAVSNVAATVGLADDAAKVIKLSPDVQEQCLKVLRAGMRGDEFWPAMHAAEALTLGGYDSEVVEFLSPLLAVQTDDQKRCGIARELVRAGDHRPVALMLSILAGENSHGHVHAAESLFKVAEIGDGVAMRMRFQSTENPSLKMMAAGALSRCGASAPAAYLRDMLSHQDIQHASIAAWVIGQTGTTQDVPLLKQQLARCSDEGTRAFFEHALAVLGDSDGLKALERNLSSTDPMIRTYAATFAGDARAVWLAEPLTKLLTDSHSDAAIRAAQSLLVLSRPPASSDVDDISQIVFEATPSHPRYTEGSIVELRDGSLLFAITEFHESDDDFAKARIVARRSGDGGHTWGPVRVLQENTGMLNVMSVTLRRVSPETVAMFYLQKDSHSNLNLYVRMSDDETETFGDPIQVTTDAGYHVVNNDRVTQLSSGRLLAPAASTPDVTTVNHFVSHVYISDDQGRTWRPGKGHVDAPQRGAMEPEVIELNDGRVLMIIRNQLGFVGRSWSSDGGDTWTEMSNLGVKAPEAPATLRRIPATGDLLLIWNHTYDAALGHGGPRTPLTAAISADEGTTWTHVRNLEANPMATFSYTGLTFVKKRAVMNYWENPADSGRYAARFRSVPVRWFYGE
jgi:sialidase-1